MKNELIKNDRYRSYNYYPYDKYKSDTIKRDKQNIRPNISTVEEIKEAIRKNPIDTLFKIVIYIIALSLGIGIAARMIISFLR